MGNFRKMSKQRPIIEKRIEITRDEFMKNLLKYNRMANQTTLVIVKDGEHVTAVIGGSLNFEEP